MADAGSAPDGSPVGLYAALPPDGEPELIHAALPAGAAILELGCGAGRLTHALLALGHPLVAVDQAAAMLAHVRGAETALADIETLALGRRFAGVLLASYLVNTDDDARRAAFLQTCHRHLAADGVAFIQRYAPRWAEEATTFALDHLGLHVAFRVTAREGRRFSTVIDCTRGDARWQHLTTARILNNAEFDAALAAAGLRRVRWLDAAQTWAEAAAAP